MTDTDPPTNPLEPSEKLQPGIADSTTKQQHPQSEIFATDSAVTKAEKIERHDENGTNGENGERAAKRVKLDGADATDSSPPETKPRVKGVAPIKAEFLIPHTPGRPQNGDMHDDDAAEAGGKVDDRDGGGKKDKKSKRQKGAGGSQNKARTFGSSRDELQLCSSRSNFDEFSPGECRFKETCRYEHDLRKYLAEGKRKDLDTFNGTCPVFEAKGDCNYGWKCRFAGSHSEEKTLEDGRKELRLIRKDISTKNGVETEDDGHGVVNIVSVESKVLLRKKQTNMPKSDKINAWIEQRQKSIDKAYSAVEGQHEKADIRAGYVEAPLRPSEKRRIYYGPETPILAPLTTQGNLPFRRLCVGLGAQVTWSEMAMGLPLLQGEKGEWALLKAHESELTAPRYSPRSILAGYDNSKDIRFGAQIAANKPWLATKTAEVLTDLCPHLRAIDLNCGCPIELVYRQGAGSALMDNPGRMEKILRGMNVVSKDVPITVKIRMGTKDSQPTADKLVHRLILGGGESQELGEGPAGVAAITLHGRSRQQRYTRSADWEYIAQTAATIDRLRAAEGDKMDTVREADARDQSGNGVYFIGNGDCYSHEDYYSHLKDAKVDAVMIARGALIKPWIFEEISAGQYLDKSASERLEYVEKFAKFGLEYWGSDEVGVGTTRRFLLEWLSFSCRYVPVGLLEHLPPRLGDRPPIFRGRNELETLMCSPNYLDWIKIR